jgi:hypothetical protein
LKLPTKIPGEMPSSSANATNFSLESGRCRTNEFIDALGIRTFAAKLFGSFSSCSSLYIESSKNLVFLPLQQDMGSFMKESKPDVVIDLIPAAHLNDVSRNCRDDPRRSIHLADTLIAVIRDIQVLAASSVTPVGYTNDALVAATPSPAMPPPATVVISPMGRAG